LEIAERGVEVGRAGGALQVDAQGRFLHPGVTESSKARTDQCPGDPAPAPRPGGGDVLGVSPFASESLVLDRVDVVAYLTDDFVTGPGHAPQRRIPVGVVEEALPIGFTAFRGSPGVPEGFCVRLPDLAKMGVLDRSHLHTRGQRGLRYVVEARTDHLGAVAKSYESSLLQDLGPGRRLGRPHDQILDSRGMGSGYLRGPLLDPVV